MKRTQDLNQDLSKMKIEDVVVFKCHIICAGVHADGEMERPL